MELTARLHRGDARMIEGAELGPKILALERGKNQLLDASAFTMAVLKGGQKLAPYSGAPITTVLSACLSFGFQKRDSDPGPTYSLYSLSLAKYAKRIPSKREVQISSFRDDPFGVDRNRYRPHCTTTTQTTSYHARSAKNLCSAA